MPPLRWRSLWMRRLRDPQRAESVLRHEAFVDRAPLEVALSSFFFAPFVHQEVVEGEAFRRRAAWSRAALGAHRDAEVEATVTASLVRWVDGRDWPSTVESLLDAVRGVVVHALAELALGPRAGALRHDLEALAADFDRGIKLVGPRDLAHRRRLRRGLQARDWTAAPWVAAGQAASPLDRRELADQIGAVVFGTGVIQLTDVVTHALIALDQHPGSAVEPAVRVLRETWRCYPVNASLTRRASRPALVEGMSFEAGEAVEVVPGLLNRRGWRDPHQFHPARWGGEMRGASWSFGHGPRRCPAAAFSLAFASAFLDAWRERIAWSVESGYRHRRSLARPAATALARRGEPVKRPPARPSARFWREYGSRILRTYPRAAVTWLLDRS